VAYGVLKSKPPKVRPQAASHTDLCLLSLAWRSKSCYASCTAIVPALFITLITPARFSAQLDPELLPCPKFKMAQIALSIISLISGSILGIIPLALSDGNSPATLDPLAAGNSLVSPRDRAER
jgi:hypothetical protein